MAIYEKHLLYKYTHVGCPAQHYEDICAHPAECAENGRCKALASHPDDGLDGSACGIFSGYGDYDKD